MTVMQRFALVGEQNEMMELVDMNEKYYLISNEISRTRKDFIFAFLELCYENNPDKIKVVDVIAKADYSRSAFYLNYKSIDELANDIVDIQMGSVAKIICDETKKRNSCDNNAEFVDAFEKIYDTVYSNRSFYELVFRNDIKLFQKQTCEKKLRQKLSEGMPEWRDKKSGKVTESCFLMCSIFFAIIEHWAYTGYKKDAKTLASEQNSEEIIKYCQFVERKGGALGGTDGS